MEEKKVYVVVVPEDDEMFSELEKAWYELQADQSTVAFCMAQPEVNFDAINEFRANIAKEFAKAEMLKGALGREHAPEWVDLKKFNFAFDFNLREITYTEA